MILLVCVPTLSAWLAEEQYNALQALYEATDGPHWNFTIKHQKLRSTETVDNLVLNEMTNDAMSGGIESEENEIMNFITVRSYEMDEVTGKEWDFSSGEDPCVNHWMGIVCNTTAEMCSSESCGVRDLVLNGVGLAGELPDSLSALTDLRALSLQNNKLSSSLPSSIGSLQGLRLLSLSVNDISGPIPASIARLSNLMVFDVLANMLCNEIPEEVREATFSDLIVFYVGENLLSGPIPLLSGALNMEQIYLTENLFSGTIPDSFYNFAKLTYLGVSTNNIDGSISPRLGNLVSLRNFYLGYNLLQNSIPSEVGKLLDLEYFEASRNALSGSIPTEFGELTNLLVLELNINYFSASLPFELGNLELMHTLYLHENEFQGTIPDSYSKLESMQLFVLGYNSLTGTIPSSLSTLSKLLDFSVYNNQLTGYLPGEFFLLPNLEKLLLQNNAFEGFQLQNISLDSKPNISISYLDISNNRFHGTLPSELFSQMSNIQSLAATKNCFSGSLPSAICNASTLRVLTLDGLASGDTCRQSFMYPFSLFNAYLIHPLDGTIPACYWQMPNLTVLHLSGNGLGGSIASDISPSLLNISLSFNRLTGSIPAYLMQNHFVELSLSNNKLRGVFDDVQENCRQINRSILDIRTNRLSGYTPEHLADVHDLHALEGNLFDCNHKHTLPSNDPFDDEYICASKQLTQPYFAWILIFAFFAIICSFLFYYWHFDSNDCDNEHIGRNKINYSVRQLLEWYSLKELEYDTFSPQCSKVFAPNLKAFVTMLRTLRKTFVVLSAALCAICLPLYYLLKREFDGYYSTHEHQYAWKFSIAYMSGPAAALIVMVIFWISCFYVTFSLNAAITVKTTDADEKGAIKTSDESNSASDMKRTESGSSYKMPVRNIICYAAVMLFNIAIYLLVNSGYIYLLLSASLDSSMKLLANFAMAIVKLVWNLFIVPVSIETAVSALNDDIHNLKWMIAFLLLFNNIAAPSLATAFTDDKCYEQVIAPSSEINAFYELPVCNIYQLELSTGARDCYQYVMLLIETPFHAPFIYNYQCSSSLIVNYVPVFLFAYAFLAVMFPLLFTLFTATNMYSLLPQNLKDVVPTLLVPPSKLLAHPQSPHVPVIRPDRIIATLMSHFAVLLSFGVAFPILGFVIGFTVCVLTATHQVCIGRHLSYHSGSKDAECNLTIYGNIDGSKYSGGLEPLCTKFLSGLRRCLWTIIIGSNILVGAAIVFDFVGDKRSFETAILSASLAVVCGPIIIFVSFRVALWLGENGSTTNLTGRSLLDQESASATTPLLESVDNS